MATRINTNLEQAKDLGRRAVTDDPQQIVDGLNESHAGNCDLKGGICNFGAG